MKKVLLSFILVMFLICIPELALASSGSAVISNLSWYHLGSDYEMAYIYVSNLTNEQITIKITIFNMDGAIFKSLSTDLNTVQNFTTNVSDASVSFTLNAYCTGRVYINIPDGTYPNCGYGRISWSNTSLNATYSVTAHILKGWVWYGTHLLTEAPINNGLPF